MAPAVRHQNVPHIINDNSGRVVELAVPSSGGSESSDGLEIVRVENVDLIPWVYILPRNPYFFPGPTWPQQRTHRYNILSKFLILPRNP